MAISHGSSGRSRGVVGATAVAALSALGACTTAGSAWMAQPLAGDDPSWATTPPPPRPEGSARAPGHAVPLASAEAETPGDAVAGGRVIGTFRNTYYNFPSERDYQGATTKLMSATCSPLAEVPRGFHDAVCVQGSGRLASGVTVSFARRDCECAEVCPRSGQKICFDSLDAGQFPWGRGSTGRAITPLLTVAVDPSVIPIGTVLYVPDYDGAPRTEGGSPARHDGCFLAQDRGVRVQGLHIDIFTGNESTTTLWNQVVPSNKGVAVVVDSPRCQRLSTVTP